ncbi:hypothetical protein [Selenihalanaerobacter shriftii]|uniref:Uncharacterized protein n=1 Tax=Selenihalanaerobacter shriftii TaxID=142842 RepID=A0A1T4PM24_9FIRM|nr:hypothetical protein [Selenihalanaerobacter shriftii]SJZ91938.1 hypothetical protein SAMN02745118_02208 [Selenihalanaerobacter shriftii]
MEYIVIEGNKTEVMQEMINYTNSGRLVDDTFNFIIKNRHILDSSEELYIDDNEPILPMQGPRNWVSMNAKYHINVKKTTILLVMFILDVTLTKGIANVLASVFGVTTQTINKLDEQDRCLILDIMKGKKFSATDFFYKNSECVQNDIDCSFRDGCICSRELEVIESRLASLIDAGIVINGDSEFKLAF